jgi:hypothetical protein
MNSRKRKQDVLQHFFARLHNPALRWSSAEDRAWDNMVPVGREFGSPDYEKLMQQDELEFKSRLFKLVADGQAAVSRMVPPEKSSELSDALNVQAALRQWGHEVDVAVAASVWRSYSNSLSAQWLSGAETVSTAKRALFYYCSRRRSTT